MIRIAVTLPVCFFFAYCCATAVPQDGPGPSSIPLSDSTAGQPFVVVLGIAQDAGFPQAGCQRRCCLDAWRKPARRRQVACLAIVDPQSGQRWVIDCTPDFREQLQQLTAITPQRGIEQKGRPVLDGILLTHAHTGHYSGLIHLGREAIGARNVPVWAMPRMRNFLTANGPWSQLVSLENIRLKALTDNVSVPLNSRIRVTPFTVPHRDEFSETVGFQVTGPQRTVIYIPDIDKWSRWSRQIEDVIRSADLTYLDGTFFANGEIPGRDMSLIPHPFIEESLSRFTDLSVTERNRVRFIHLNHTNPALHPDSAAARIIHKAGCAVAVQGERFGL